MSVRYKLFLFLLLPCFIYSGGELPTLTEKMVELFPYDSDDEGDLFFDPAVDQPVEFFQRVMTHYNISTQSSLLERLRCLYWYGLPLFNWAEAYKAEREALRSSSGSTASLPSDDYLNYCTIKSKLTPFRDLLIRDRAWILCSANFHELQECRSLAEKVFGPKKIPELLASIDARMNLMLRPNDITFPYILERKRLLEGDRESLTSYRERLRLREKKLRERLREADDAVRVAADFASVGPKSAKNSVLERSVLLRHQLQSTSEQKKWAIAALQDVVSQAYSFWLAPALSVDLRDSSLLQSED